MPSHIHEGDSLRWVRRREGASWEIGLLIPRYQGTRHTKVAFLFGDDPWDEDEIREAGGEIGEDVAIPTQYANDVFQRLKQHSALRDGT